MSCKFKLLKLENEKALYGACEDTQINLQLNANPSETVFNLRVASKDDCLPKTLDLKYSLIGVRLQSRKITRRPQEDHKFEDVNYALFGAVDVYSVLCR